MTEKEKNPAESEGGFEADVDVVERSLAEPPKYAVVLLNDDFTTMEFVIEVLQRFFRRNTEEAYAIMLKVHEEGRGVAGIYTFEIAETKCVQVMDYAKKSGHPLKCIAEPVLGSGERK